MAMDLNLWAQLNLIGHVSYQEYLDMTREEAVACFNALNSAIERAKSNQFSTASAEAHFSRYGG